MVVTLFNSRFAQGKLQFILGENLNILCDTLTGCNISYEI